MQALHPQRGLTLIEAAVENREYVDATVVTTH